MHRFRFNSKKGVDTQALTTLERELGASRQQIELALKNGAQELEQIRATTLAQRQALQWQMEIVFGQMRQAEANLQAVQG